MGAAKAHGDRLDRPPDLKNRGFSEAVGSDIDLGRERIVAAVICPFVQPRPGGWHSVARAFPAPHQSGGEGPPRP